MFLNLQDFRQVIKDEQLAQILPPSLAPLSVGERPDKPTGRLEDAPVLHQAVLQTIAEMQSYLRHRYDVATLFAATGTSRNPILVLYALDITLYHLLARIDPRRIAQLRMDRYDAAISWLNKVAQGELLPDFPPLPDGDTGGHMNFGSNARTTHRL